MSYLGDVFSIPTQPAAGTAPEPEAPSSKMQPSPATQPEAPKTEVSVPIAPGFPSDGGLLLANAPAPEAAAEEPTAETLVVAVTPRAAKEVHRIVEEQKLPAATGLRLGVQGGGCSGFSYKLGFEAMKAPLDWEGESEGIKIYIDPKSFLYLSGVELDFQDSLMGRGFVFNNPNAKKTCGCGESFQV